MLCGVASVVICSTNWAVRRSLRGSKRFFFSSFSKLLEKHVLLSRAANHISEGVHAWDDHPRLMPRCCVTVPRGRNTDPQGKTLRGLTSFCNIEARLPQSNRGLCMQMELWEKQCCYWSRRYGLAVKTPTADVSLFTWTLFIVQQLLGAAALFMDSSCPSTSAAQHLHAKRHFLLVCARGFMDCKCRQCNGIR